MAMFPARLSLTSALLHETPINARVMSTDIAHIKKGTKNFLLLSPAKHEYHYKMLQSLLVRNSKAMPQ